MVEETPWGLRNVGVPHYEQFLHPVIKKNYGKWAYHEHVKPGVIKHVAESGDVLYTIRVGLPKYVSTQTVRELCDIADKYSQGYIKFTSRHSATFFATDEETVDKIIQEVESKGFPVGGTDHSLKSIINCVGWTHCHTAATDSPSIAKALYEALYDYFKSYDKLPERLKIAVSGCLNMCGATHASDIAIIGVHRKAPRVIDEDVKAFCSVPALVKICPKYAIRPKKGDPRSVEIDEEKCMYCGICYGECPGLPIHDPKNDGVSIWVGGKVPSTKKGPMNSRLVIPYLPNNPPHWPEVVDAVKKIVDFYVKYAEPDERLGETIERIGWEKFFKLTGIPFTDKHIDDYVFSYMEFRKGVTFKHT